MVVTVVTGNPQKAEFFCGSLAAAGITAAPLIRVLDELQAGDIEAVAIDKARQARSHAPLPLLVEDSGLVIDALKGFPGPVTRYALETVGVAGLIALAAANSCAIKSVTVVIDLERRRHLFVDRLEGTLVASQSQIPDGKPDDLWRIFVPLGEQQPFASVGRERQQRYIEQRRERLSAWLGKLHETAAAAP